MKIRPKSQKPYQFLIMTQCYIHANLAPNDPLVSPREIILQYFRPSLSHYLSLRPLFYLFLSGILRQVLLYGWIRKYSQFFAQFCCLSGSMYFTSCGRNRPPELFIHFFFITCYHFFYLLHYYCSYQRFIAQYLLVIITWNTHVKTFFYYYIFFIFITINVFTAFINSSVKKVKETLHIMQKHAFSQEWEPKK